jgi:hypothetical protein
MPNTSSNQPQGFIDKIKDALGLGNRDMPDATIQPSSNDTPPTEGGIGAAPHMGDDDSLMPVGTDETGPVVTPSTAGESPDTPLDQPEVDRPHR